MKATALTGTMLSPRCSPRCRAGCGDGDPTARKGRATAQRQGGALRTVASREGGLLNKQSANPLHLPPAARSPPPPPVRRSYVTAEQAEGQQDAVAILSHHRDVNSFCPQALKPPRESWGHSAPVLRLLVKLSMALSRLSWNRTFIFC